MINPPPVCGTEHAKHAAIYCTEHAKDAGIYCTEHAEDSVIIHIAQIHHNVNTPHPKKTLFPPISVSHTLVFYLKVLLRCTGS